MNGQLMAKPLSSGPALKAEDARRLAAALNEADVTRAEVEHRLEAAQSRGEAVLEASMRRHQREAAR